MSTSPRTGSSPSAADWIVTVRRCPTGLDSQRAWLASQGIKDEDEVLYHVLDALADGWDPVVEVLDRRVDDVEAEVLERPVQEHLRLIYRLKQEVTELQRRAGPQRSIFVPAVQAVHRLGDRTEGSRAWLADVEAHLDSIASDLRRISGDLTALTDTFFNSNANRLNRLATRFAVGSVFFLLWTLVTGFFGQNFEYLVGSVQSRGDFLLYGVGSLVVPTVVLAGVLWWKRDSWW